MILPPQLVGRLPYRLLRALRIRTRAVNGGSLIVPVLGAMRLPEGAHHDRWRPALFRRLASLVPGTFVDIGANLGQTLLDAREAMPNEAYVGFEPNPVCVDYLSELIDANGMANCTIIPVGVSDHDGIVTLYRDPENHGDQCATIRPDLRPGRPVRSSFVPVQRFDALRESLGLGQVGLIKIDVEGAELEVLRGMEATLSACRPVVLCEVLTADSRADLAAAAVRNAELAELLRDLGYRVLQLLKLPDESAIVGVRSLEAFPAEVWKQENKHLCDYLFCPDELVDNVRAALP